MGNLLGWVGFIVHLKKVLAQDLEWSVLVFGAELTELAA